MGLRDRLKRRLGLGGPPSVRPAETTLPAGPDADGFRAVAPSAGVGEGRAGMFDVAGTTVAVFRTGGRLFAVDNACNHEDGPLGEGRVDGTVVTCPYHDWRYDLASGACLTDPARPIATYAVKESGGLLWVGRRLREGSRERGGDHDDGLVTKKVD